MRKLIIFILSMISIAWTPADDNRAVILGHSVTSGWMERLTLSAKNDTFGIDGTDYVETCCDAFSSDWATDGDYTGQNLEVFEFYNPDNPSVPLDLVHPPSGMWALSEMDWTAESCERNGQTWDAIYAPRTWEQITPHWKFLEQVAPKWLFVNCEYNDVWRHYHPSWHNGSMQSVRDEYVKLVDKLQAACPTCEIVLMSSPPAIYTRPRCLYGEGPPEVYKPLLYYGEITSENVSEYNCNEYQNGTCSSLEGYPNEYAYRVVGDCYTICSAYFNQNHFITARWIKSLAYSRGLRYVGLFDEVGIQYGLDATGLDAFGADYLTADGSGPDCLTDGVHIPEDYQNKAFYTNIIIPALTKGFRKNKASFRAAQ